MPASVTSIARKGVYAVLEAHLPGLPARNIGVCLVDPSTDKLWLRMLADYGEWGEDGDTEVLQALEDDLRARASTLGAEGLLQWLEDCASNTLRIGDRHTVEVDAFTRVLARLFDEQVERIPVQPFQTHVPLFSLRAAAGSLGEEMESAAEDWVPAPDGVRLDPNLFAAHVVGHSMEPRIPDGSLNLFRFHPVGSRQNKILLIQRFGVTDESARYTIKKYTSRKVQLDEDQWQHEQIRLVALNPEYQSWDVEPQDFAVVAEWLQVLE